MSHRRTTRFSLSSMAFRSEERNDRGSNSGAQQHADKRAGSETKDRTEERRDVAERDLQTSHRQTDRPSDQQSDLITSTEGSTPRHDVSGGAAVRQAGCDMTRSAMIADARNSSRRWMRLTPRYHKSRI